MKGKSLFTDECITGAVLPFEEKLRRKIGGWGA
jgi:hypothetical protein